MMKSKLRDLDLPYFIRGGSWLILGIFLGAAGGLISSSILSRFFNPDDFGKYTLIISVFAFLSSISLPGMNQVLFQASSENKDGVYFDAIKIVFKFSIIGFLILLSLSLYFYLLGNNSLAPTFLITSFLFPLFATFSLYSPFLNGKKLFRESSLFGSLSQLITIVLIVVAILIFHTLAVVAFAAILGTTLSNVLFTIYSFKKIKNKKRDHKLVHMGISISKSQLLSISADYLDDLLVPALLGFSQNAVYALAILIPTQLNNFLKLFPTLITPQLSKIDDRLVKKYINNKLLPLIILVIVGTLLYIVLAPEIFHFFYPKYENSSVKFSQLFAITLLFAPANVLYATLVKLRAGRSINQSNLIYSLATIVTFAILIPLMGLIGAILAKLLVRCLQFIILFIYYQKQVRES